LTLLIALGLSACGQQDADAPEASQATELRRQDNSVMAAMAAMDEMRAGLDTAITGRVYQALEQDAVLRSLEVQTWRGHVVLNGLVPDERARQRAEALTRAVEGVVELDNRLQVGPRR